ncbi:KTI12 [Candida pseudojiufengensis]|uniref:KTI12 n=1 Tax=Candida pseudojiufengensis TaxID=497109 RepID=UPI002224FD6E|nr:KTI12 [Candida pseudojiufengensis]KAI5963602.1 KTI12 [Candida pseudojiufengensis]
MPLIILSGYPSSGKTKWAKALIEQLEKKICLAKEDSNHLPGHNYKVIYHSDETLGISHDTYKDSNKEKLARGSQISAVKRDISKTNIVILDSMAYIKGFRYQLYCESKGMATPHCVVHVIAPIEQCLEWNSSRDSSEQWEPTLIKQLEMRYEEPNSDTRWDSPLFQIISNDQQEMIPIEDIWNALVLKKAPTPNAATTLQSTSDNTFLQELDRKTHEIISKILQQQQITSGDVQIDDYTIEIPMGVVSTAQLQRIRRSFINLNRMRTIDKDRIIPLFIDYLNGSLNND